MVYVFIEVYIFIVLYQYEVWKLSDETGSVAFDMATLEARDLEGRQVDMR